jgi:hypothetical protein
MNLLKTTYNFEIVIPMFQTLSIFSKIIQLCKSKISKTMLKWLQDTII